MKTISLFISLVLVAGLALVVAPVPVAQRIGTRAMNVVVTVIIFGLMR